ncbi:MAG: hypothetical protein GX815_00955 [Clostridiales bacterium]|nr:hypothetical protein [Clostridiales bacterium]
MDFEKDLLEELGTKPCLRPECILTDKVFDSCFQRECEPSKVIDLPCKGAFTDVNVVYGTGFIVDGTLDITPLETNFARVRFVFRVPFVVTAYDMEKREPVTINDYVEFAKDIRVFLPQAPSEFSFRIVIETRTETLSTQIVGNQIILSIGVFVIVKVVGFVQLLVQSWGYCPAPRECQEFLPEDVCDDFETRPVPPFFPPQLEDLNGIA